MKLGKALYVIIALVQASTWAGEFQVNVLAANSPTQPAIAMDLAGNFAVVWRRYTAGYSGEILGRLFDANGQAQSGEFRINTTTEGNQKEPSVAMDSAGNFVVVWQGPGAEGYDEDIFAQRFDPNGQRLEDEGEFIVNSSGFGRQLAPNAAINASGAFVVVWESANDPENARDVSIYARQYDSSGTPAEPEFKVSESTTCRDPDVAMDQTGDFVIVWTHDSSTNSIRLCRYHADGTHKGDPFAISTIDFTSLTDVSVAVDSAGNFFVAWDGDPVSYDYDDIHAKGYHWTGFEFGEQFVVNTYRAGVQSNPSVAFNDDGHLVIVWESLSQDGEGWGIFGQRFNVTGEFPGEDFSIDTCGDEFGVNSFVAGDQKYPAIVMNPAGQFVTTWLSSGQYTSNWGIFGEFGPKASSADVSGDGFVNFYDYAILADEYLEVGTSLKTDLVDDNTVDLLDLAAFVQQWLSVCYECDELDINGDGKIDFRDYGFWANDWLRHGPNLDGDITANGIVDLADLRALLFGWGQNCQ